MQRPVKTSMRDFRLKAQIRVIAALLLLAVGPSAFALTRAEGAASLVDRLQRHYQATTSFTAQFVETLSNPGGPPRQRTGRVFYRKPGMIRWEFAAPEPETIVADGATLFDYDPGLNQVVEMPLKKAFDNRSAAAFILGVGNLKRDYTISVPAESSKDGLIHLVATPKDGGNKIELGLDSKTLNITTLRIVDGLGNSTALQFSDIARNVAVDDGLFKFAPPAGADIVNGAPSSR
jgi:outer membrane lipoprotein carrier protein